MIHYIKETGRVKERLGGRVKREQRKGKGSVPGNSHKNYLLNCHYQIRTNCLDPLTRRLSKEKNTSSVIPRQNK